MALVHVFISTGRFRTFEEMRRFIDQTYTEDGEGIASEFMKEVGLTEYEPMCIEAIPSVDGTVIRLEKLLACASYSNQWLKKLNITPTADAAICVFPPNLLESTGHCSMEYLGAFQYEP